MKTGRSGLGRKCETVSHKKTQENTKGTKRRRTEEEEERENENALRKASRHGSVNIGSS